MGQATYFGSGARPKGLRVGRVVVERAASRNAVIYPSWVWGRASTAKRFPSILGAPDGLAWNLLGANFVHHGPP